MYILGLVEAWEGRIWYGYVHGMHKSRHEVGSENRFGKE